MIPVVAQDLRAKAANALSHIARALRKLRWLDIGDTPGGDLGAYRGNAAAVERAVRRLLRLRPGGSGG
jgi:hypothetical protein